MNFIVSLAKIPGGFFAAIFLKKFPTRPVFLTCAILIIAAHIMMGLTNMMLLPPVFAMIAIGIIQFTASGGYISVSYLLLGVLLPASSRSTFTGLVGMLGGLSALTLNAVRPYIVNTPIGDAGLFFVFAAVVTACLIYMFFMMPETKGITMEQIEYIFLCPPHEGCAIRRDPNRIITNAFESVTKVVERVSVMISNAVMFGQNICSTKSAVYNMIENWSCLSFLLNSILFLTIPFRCSSSQGCPVSHCLGSSKGGMRGAGPCRPLPW